ncbi:MAG: hypothetical protein RL021_809 [Bacteroidota bacterium]|jgi:ABC-type multidrug transport system ATPase subunit
MDGRTLDALTRLFAAGSRIRSSPSHRRFVEEFLRQQLPEEKIEAALVVFDHYCKEALHAEETQNTDFVPSITAVCSDINQGLEARQKYVVFLRICEFMLLEAEAEVAETSLFLSTVSDTFRLSKQEGDSIREIGSLHPDASRLSSAGALRIYGHDAKSGSAGMQVELHDLRGEMWVLNLQRSGIMLVRYSGPDNWVLNGQPVDKRQAIVLARGSVLRNQLSTAVYFTELQQRFLASTVSVRLEFETEDADFRFDKDTIGLHPLSLRCTTGEMVAIMGGSGAGKSTLLNLLNGNLKPSSGRILINGIDVWKDPQITRGLVGYIPQDDLLIEELSVFQNLYYNTKLCFGDLDDWRITGKVNDMLKSIGLWEARDLKVGDPLNKTISGGQRKRLNIALELIREPAILFVDEPTSGLSSRDAENVMDLLKQLALSGKLVFVVIHQPSSDIFKLFDRLVMLDKGGYLVYDGMPVEAITYFSREAGVLESNDGVCNSCGNVNPEQVFNILEQESIDELGERKGERRITPTEWYKRWRNQREKGPTKKRERISTPPAGTIASFRQQLYLFFKRDLLSKLANRQYLLINLLEAPLLALVLGWLLRYTVPGKDYQFYFNENIPAYLFISVVVALFFGLSVSGEEILRDRKIRQRESFLFLSRTAYIWSKIGLLFTISAIQMASFVLVGNTLLGIKGMYTSFFWVLFTTACFSNVLGLIISSAMRSAVAVYILIPIMIIPQILLSGVIVKFNKLNNLIGSPLEVSMIGNFMASRWAYEAMAVHQFSDNGYERVFFPYDAAMSRATFVKDFWVPQMRQRVAKCKKLVSDNSSSPQNAELLDKNWKLLLTEFSKGVTAEGLGLKDGVYDERLRPDIGILDRMILQLDSIREDAMNTFNLNSGKKEQRISALEAKGITVKMQEDRMMKETNLALSDMLLNQLETEKIIETAGELRPQFEPVYRKATGRRSFWQQPFFAAEKSVAGIRLDTYTANVMVLWLMTVLLYVLLHTDGLNKLLNRNRSHS